MARWRSGLTHYPFTVAVSGVRIPYGSPQGSSLEVKQRADNAESGGSIPPFPTNLINTCRAYLVCKRVKQSQVRLLSCALVRFCTEVIECVDKWIKSGTFNIAEWSSLVARRAHNPKVPGAKPGSATIVLLVESRYNTVGFDSPMDAD